MSLKETLFGSNGSAGIEYKIIFFSFSTILGAKGSEDVFNVVYGDDTYIYTSNFSSRSVTLSYASDDKHIVPIIKLSRQSITGVAKAEIIFPRGFSFLTQSSANRDTDKTPKSITVDEGWHRQAGVAVDITDSAKTVEQRKPSSGDLFITSDTALDADKPADTHIEIMSQSHLQPDAATPTLPEHLHCVDDDAIQMSMDADVLEAKIKKFQQRHAEIRKRMEYHDVEEGGQPTDDLMDRFNKNANRFFSITDPTIGKGTEGKD